MAVTIHGTPQQRCSQTTPMHSVTNDVAHADASITLELYHADEAPIAYMAKFHGTATSAVASSWFDPTTLNTPVDSVRVGVCA